MTALDEAARECIASADTFFVASHFTGDEEHPEPMVDVSHRGGKPGFVHVEGNLLRIPDFAGNMHFNTFGNFLLNPNAGLLFIDFASGNLLELAERRGMEPEFSCRGGSCGTCRTQVEAGQVSYLSAPAFRCAPGEALLCCAMPAEGERRIVLKL